MARRRTEFELQAGDRLLHRRRQRLVGAVEVDPERVPADRGRHQEIQDGDVGRFGQERQIRVPEVGLGRAVGPSSIHSRTAPVPTDPARGVRRPIDGAERGGKGQVLVIGEVLVPPEQDQVAGEGRRHVGALLGGSTAPGGRDRGPPPRYGASGPRPRSWRSQPSGADPPPDLDGSAGARPVPARPTTPRVRRPARNSHSIHSAVRFRAAGWADCRRGRQGRLRVLLRRRGSDRGHRAGGAPLRPRADPGAGAVVNQPARRGAHIPGRLRELLPEDDASQRGDGAGLRRGRACRR